jgi:hypothetical protein
MRSRTSAFAGLFVVWASLASAQPWKDAYDRQDYTTAASLLQAIVFEHSAQGGARYPDVQAIQTLAQLYAEGRGVPRDPVTACSLSNFGSGAAVYRHGDRDARTVAIQRQVESHCVPLTPVERREAMQPDGCLLQGPEPRVLFVSATRRVELGRSGLTVVDRGDAHEYPLAPFVRCAQQVPKVRYVRVAAPKGTRLPAREFVELYSWHSASRDGRKVRTLEWSAIELTPRSMALRARTVLEQTEGSAWPARPVPDEFARGVVFTMHRSGDVRWQMNGSRSLHGVIGRPGALRASATTR